MLKFSGFADLTSCLVDEASGVELLQNSATTKYTGVCCKLPVVSRTYALNASRSKKALTHKHAQSTYPPGAEAVNGIER